MSVAVITHRGLQPSREGHPFESSLEAFQYQIGRGWGLEFDPNFTKDRTVGKSIIVMHNRNLKRVTNGADERMVREVPFDEMRSMKLPGGFTVPSLHEVLELIETHDSTISAMHLKGTFQDGNDDVDLLLAHLKTLPNVIDRMMIFDVKPEVARRMLNQIPGLILAPSVAHQHDIERYNGAVKGTLISVDDAIKYGPNGEKLYKWVWGDEWDLADRGNGQKKLYTRETFDELHDAGYQIALVTPELHGTSPGLLGGETHPDATPREKLFDRIKDIVAASPDAVCTDYPEEVEKIVKNKE